MALTSVYKAGTASVGAGGVAVTGVGTQWVSAGVQEGDFFCAAGLTVRIAAVNSATSLTLDADDAWPGQTRNGASYKIIYMDDVQRFAAQTGTLLDQLGNGNIGSLRLLDTVADRIAYYTGKGVSALAVLTSRARNLLAASTVKDACEAIGAAQADSAVLTNTTTLRGTRKTELGAAGQLVITDAIGRTDKIDRWRTYYNPDESLSLAPHSATGAWLGTAVRFAQDKSTIFASNSLVPPGYGTGPGGTVDGLGRFANGVTGAPENACYQRDTSGEYARFFYGNLYQTPTRVGQISTDGLSTIYGTASDYRLKTDVTPLIPFTLTPEQFDGLDNALLRLMGMLPVSYRRVDDPANALQTGFLAHQLQQVAPHAVTGTKDAVQEVGRVEIPAIVIDDVEVSPARTLENVPEGLAHGHPWTKTGTGPVFQTVDHSKIVPDLVAAMQALTLMVLALTPPTENHGDTQGG